MAHPHHVGGPAQTHETGDHPAAQGTPAPPHCTHLEAQLCGMGQHTVSGGGGLFYWHMMGKSRSHTAQDIAPY